MSKRLKKISHASKEDPEEQKSLISLGKVEPQEIQKEMEEAYLDYAMSVIVSRALPDVRDGLKPVHRRILFSMWQNGLRSGAKFKKCAAVVGDVLARYHPHGDLAIYYSLARMAQDFSLRYPLVRGQGNFGSLDGDAPAAYRYTESKLERICEELILDIEKQTVDFRPTFDGSQKEPVVLPARLPNLLLNGDFGIAVGMATKIPPHNLGELCDALVHLLNHPQATVEDLLKYIQGPDFPTGAIVYNSKDIHQAYSTGKGGVVVRAKTEIIETKKGTQQILVQEIPYQVNKASLLEKIALLVREKKIEGIKDLWDESTKDGVRIVIELKKDAYPRKILNRLYQTTPLQDTFHYNMIALVDGIQPRVLTLKMILEEHIKHRKEVIRRRTQFDLDRAKERAHILEGLRLALLQIDKIIAAIKSSKDKEEAQSNLCKKFHLTEIQAQAILEMRLQQLANLERLKIEQEYEEKMRLIKELESILQSDNKMKGMIETEILNLKEEYGDERRTQIVSHSIKEFSMEDVIPDTLTMVMITRGGYIKRISPDTFRQQKRGGKGIVGLTTKEEDEVEEIFSTSTHKQLLFFTTRGRVFSLKAYEVPEATRTAKGQALVNFLSLAPGENVSRALSLDEQTAKYLLMVTKKGTVKKVDIADFQKIRSNGLRAINLKEGDVLEWIKLTTGKDEIILVTHQGQAIRFSEKDVRPMGRVASGVRGMKLKGHDEIIGMEVVTQEEQKQQKMYELLIVLENGFGKRTSLSEYKVQRRGGSGIKTAKITKKTGEIVTGRIVQNGEKKDLMIVSSFGQVIRTGITSISVLGRATQGVRIMRFKKEGDMVASTAIV